MINYLQCSFTNENLFTDLVKHLKNIYVQGGCGSGKTVLLIKTVKTLLKENSHQNIIIFDPKMVSISPKYFEGNYPNLKIYRDPAAYEHHLSNLNKQVDELLENEEIFVFVDEICCCPSLMSHMCNNAERFKTKNICFVLFSQNECVSEKLKTFRREMTEREFEIVDLKIKYNSDTNERIIAKIID